MSFIVLAFIVHHVWPGPEGDRLLVRIRRHLQSPVKYALFAALILRLLIFGVAYLRAPDLHTLSTQDTLTYVQPGRELLSSGAFTRFGETEYRRTPGYSLLLTPGVWLGHLEVYAVLLQIALGVLTVFLLFRAVRMSTGDSRLALAAAWLYALEPLSALFCSYLMTETLFVFLIVLFWHEMARYFQSQSIAALAFGAVVLSASAYVRPISYFLPAVVAMFLVARALLARVELRRQLAHAVAFVAICAPLLGAWQARNYYLAGYPGFSAIGDYNLYYFQEAAVLARTSGKTLEQAQIELGQRDSEVMFARRPEWRALSQPELFQAMGKEAKATLAEHRLQYAKIHAQGLVALLISPGTADYLMLWDAYPTARPMHAASADAGNVGVISSVLRGNRVVMLWSVGLGCILLGYLMLGLFGLWSRARCATSAELLLLAISGYFFMLSGGPTGLGRLRHPLMPCLAVLAAYGFMAIKSRLAVQTGQTPRQVEVERPYLVKKAA